MEKEANPGAQIKPGSCVSKELVVTAGLLLPGGAVSTRASQEETQDWIARVTLRSHQRSWKQKTEQNSRLTAVFSEILAKNRKPQKSHLSAPCVSVSTKSQCHHWQTPWSTWAWTGARWPWDRVGEREKWTQKREKSQNYLLKMVTRQKSNSKNISKSQMLEKRKSGQISEREKA